MLNSTATIGWLTAAHWKGHATSSPSLCWIVFNIFPLNRFSPLLTESALGVVMQVFKEQSYVYILLQYLQTFKCGLLLALKSRVSDRKGCFYEGHSMIKLFQRSVFLHQAA